MKAVRPVQDRRGSKEVPNAVCAGLREDGGEYQGFVPNGDIRGDKGVHESDPIEGVY